MDSRTFRAARIVEYQLPQPVSGEIAFGVEYLNSKGRFNLLLYN